MKTLNIEAADIGFRNFSGEPNQFNRQGDRNFVVFLDEEQAEGLEEEGWNVKWPKPNPDISEEDDDRNPFLPVDIAFNNFPPKVILIAGEQINRLGEDELDMLDWAEFEHVDLVINPYHWEVNGKKGIKAYTKAIYITIVTDEFASKYDIY